LAVLVEFFFIFSEVGGEVLPFASLGQLGIPGAVPAVEVVVGGIGGFRIAGETAVGGRQAFLFTDHHRTVHAGRLEAPFADEDLGFPVESHVESIEPFFENVERRVGSMDFDTLVGSEIAHAEVGAAFIEMDLDVLVSFLRQDGKFHLGVIGEAEVVAAAEVDLSLAVLGSHFVALDEGEVHLPLLVAQVRCPLNKDRAVDVAQAGKAVGVEAFVLGHEAEGDRNDDRDGEY
jgi:hypothetical protein